MGLLFLAILSVGCMTPPSYTITLKDGRRLHSIGFPVLNDATGYYSSQDASGKRSVFRETQVASIEPVESTS